MSHGNVGRAAVSAWGDFVVGEWFVQPDLDRVTRGEVSVHVRPQVMDLLVYLARHAGRTVPHHELLASIWPDQPFITSSALPRCIAELRQALGDRAARSTVIQTIPKRGYRLIATVGPAAGGLPPANAAAGRPPQPRSGPRAVEPTQARSSTAHVLTTVPPFGPGSGENGVRAWLLRARQITAHLLGRFGSRPD